MKSGKKVEVGTWEFKGAPKLKARQGRKPKAAEIEQGNAEAAALDPSKMKVGTIQVRMAFPDAKPWLQVTGAESGRNIFVPLPIRLITQLSLDAADGCIVRGAHGDEVKTKENILEILDRLGGYPLKSAGVWALAA
jgi:hypothetical protein